MAFIFCVPCLTCPGEHGGSVREAAGRSHLRSQWAVSIAPHPSPQGKVSVKQGQLGKDEWEM